MKRAHYMLIAGQTHWSLVKSAGQGVEVRRFEAPQNEDLIKNLREAFEELDHKGEPICLGVDSRSVYAARIETSHLPRKQRRQAMVYQLEEQLPLDAEQLTVVFLPGSAGWVTGLAVETSDIQTILDRLDQAGIDVQCIGPLALLAARQVRLSHPDAEFILLADENHVDVLRFRGEELLAWHVTARQYRSLKQCIEAELLLHPPAEEQIPKAVGVGEFDEKIAFAVTDAVSFALCEQKDRLALAMPSAGLVLDGKQRDFADFRYGPLAVSNAWKPVRHLLRAATILGGIFVLSLLTALLWRGYRYQQIAEAAERDQAAEYRSLYPGSSVPFDVHRRLESELARLTGMRGGVGLPAQHNALRTLHHIVDGIPHEVRLKLTEIQTGSTGILLEGEVKTHGDAERIYQSLAQAGFAMDAPRTEKLPAGSVGFTLTGRLPQGGVQTARVSP